MALSPTSLFQGIDTFEGEIRSAGITGTQTETDAVTTNQVTICTDTTQVSEAISAAYSVTAIDILEDPLAQDKVSFVASLAMTSTSVVVVVHTIYQSTQTPDAFQLSSEASKVFGLTSSDRDVRQFFSDYGDSYVSQVVIGGEYYAAFVYDSTTTEQQAQVTAALKSCDLAFSESLATSLSTVSSETSTSLRSNQQMFGSTGSLPASDPSSIMTFATSFPSQVNAPEILLYSISGYEHVPGVSSNAFQPVVTNRTLLGDTFVNVSAALNALNLQVTTIQDMYLGYAYSGDPDLFDKAAQVQADIDTLNTLIDNIEADVTGSFEPVTLTSLTYGTPVATFALNFWPTSSAEPNYFYDLSSAQIAEGVGPEQITVYGQGFQILYSDGTTVSHGALGNVANSLTITRTQDQDPLTQAQNQDYISAISWLSQTFNIVKVETRQGKSGGIGETETPLTTDSYTPSVPIIGFSGMTEPDQLIPIGITISPALWLQSS